MKGLEILPVVGIPEIRPGNDLSGLIGLAAGKNLQEGDILIVTHKIVSKAEGRLVDLRTIEPSAIAKDFAARHERDPRQIEVVLRESRRIVRMERGLDIRVWERPHLAFDLDTAEDLARLDEEIPRP